MKTYSEKLKDPRWQRKRLEIMERDGFRCRHCQSKEKTLNVHHRIYRKGKMPWDYEGRVFVTLCEDCHKTAEQQKERVLLMMGHGSFVDDQIALAAEIMANRQTETRADRVKFLWDIALGYILGAARSDLDIENASPIESDDLLGDVQSDAFSAIKAISSNVSHLEQSLGA